MKALRTPDERFANLPGYDFDAALRRSPGRRRRQPPHALHRRRPARRRPVLLLHGEPSWCYLYRKMIPILTAAGHRAVAPDLDRLRPLRQARQPRGLHLPAPRRLDDRARRAARPAQRHARRPGLGRADRPARRRRAPGPLRAHRRRQHVPPDRRPPGRRGVPALAAVLADSPGLRLRLDRELRLHDRPFGRRSWPPTTRRSPTTRTRRARASSRSSCRPRRTTRRPRQPQGLGSARRSGTSRSSAPSATPTRSRRAATSSSIGAVPGTKGQPHTTIAGGGHFIQEDRGEELAKVIVDWLK